MNPVLSHAVSLGFRGEKVMIVGSFIDRPGQFVSWLFQCQWSEWGIITIAGIAVFVVIWIMKRQRKLALRNIYDNQFLESTPIIGAKLGSRKKRRHLIENFKRAQQAAIQKGHSNQQTSAQKTESEKLCEQIKQLQYEIIKRREAEVRLKQQVAELTTAKDELQHELAELKQAEQPAELYEEVKPSSEEQLRTEIPENRQAEQQVDQEPVTEEKEQPVISESEQVGQDIGEEIIEVSAKDKHVEKKPPKRGMTYQDLHRVVDDVKQKLCRKCNEWKPESGFHKNALSKDGLAGLCKACKAEAAKKYRKRHKPAQE
jgi:hypothetical protein